MDFGKSIAYIFDDPQWVTKILILLVVQMVAGPLSLVLVGFALFAATNGWTVQLIRNMIDEHEHPMPAWDDFTGLIQKGIPPLGAAFVYSLIPMVLTCCFYGPVGLAGSDGSAAGIVAGLVSCIFVPLAIVYGLIAVLFFAVAIVLYAITDNRNVFYEPARLWDTIVDHRDLTQQYVIYVILAGMIAGAAGATGLGLIVTALSPAVTAHLSGQYALRLRRALKRKAV